MPEPAPSPRPEPSAQISVRGERLGAHTAIAQDGLHVAPDVTDGGAQEPGSAGVVITGVDGSTAGVAVPVPGSGPPLP
jgi:hypothetical protein